MCVYIYVYYIIYNIQALGLNFISDGQRLQNTKITDIFTVTITETKLKMCDEKTEYNTI